MVSNNNNQVALQPIQYDYLKRFIKQLEEETIAAHREAKNLRFMNHKYDSRLKEENDKAKKLREDYLDGLKAQMRNNSEARVHDL